MNQRLGNNFDADGATVVVWSLVPAVEHYLTVFRGQIFHPTFNGIIGLANKKTDFNDDVVRIASGFGELAALALQNSRFLDQRDQADQERDQVIEELKAAFSKVKKLGGLLPICASCKKVRDDRGYWNQIESYIRDHSEAEFSHSLCPECAKKLYPQIY